MRKIFAAVALLAAAALAPAQQIECKGESCSVGKPGAVAVAAPLPIPVRAAVVRQFVPSPRAAVFSGVFLGKCGDAAVGKAGGRRFALFRRAGCG